MATCGVCVVATARSKGTSLTSMLSDLVSVAMSQKSVDINMLARVFDSTQNSRSLLSRNEIHCNKVNNKSILVNTSHNAI